MLLLKRTQKLGIVTSLTEYPSDLIKLFDAFKKVSPAALEELMNSHTMSLVTWCVARISNPKEAVPSNIKALMLMLTDISPKANEIFGSNFGGVNVRTMERWLKARNANSVFGLDVLDLRPESIENTLFEVLDPIQKTMSEKLCWSYCWDETTIPEFLEISSFGAVTGQIFPNQVAKTDQVAAAGEWTELQRILSELRTMPGLKKASLVKAYVIVLQNGPKTMSPIFLWKAIPTNKSSLKLLEATYPEQAFIDAGISMIYGVRPTKQNGRFRIHAKEVTLRNDNLIEEVGGVASYVNILSEDLNKCTIVGRVLTPLENEH